MNTHPFGVISPWLILSAGASAASAVFPAIEHENIATQMHIQAGFELLNRNQNAHKNENAPAPNHVQEIDNAYLIQHPELFHRVMQQAINSHDPQLLQALNPAYRTLPQADLQTLRRSDAALARWRGDYRAAVKMHRDLQRDFPEHSRIALDYAATLFEDKQWLDAEKAFQAAQTRFRLPENVQHNVGRYVQQIRQHNRWQVHGGISLAQNRNVNQAAPRFCTPIGCQSEKPIKAVGLNYRLHIGKNTPLRGKHNLIFRTDWVGTSYYFAKKSQYDHAFGRAYLGWQHQSAKQTVSVLPFYQWQLAGSNEFDEKPLKNKTLAMNMLSHALGAQITAARQHSPRWGSSVSAELYRQNHRSHDKAQRHNGRHIQLAAGLRVQLAPSQAVLLHVGQQQFKPQQREWSGRLNNAAYSRHSLGMAWQAHWRKMGGLQTHFQAAIAQRKYKGSALNEDFLWQTQRNRERTFSASVAHDKVKWAGFAPKLIWEYSRTKSTHAWANRQQKQFLMEWNRQF